MKADVQKTKTDHITLDKSEKLELCAEISKAEAAGCECYVMHNLRTTLEVLE